MMTFEKQRIGNGTHSCAPLRVDERCADRVTCRVTPVAGAGLALNLIQGVLKPLREEGL
jgi:hypothetical protein